VKATREACERLSHAHVQVPCHVMRASCARGSRAREREAAGGVYPEALLKNVLLAIVRAEQNLELDNVMHGI
jgi:hypothetical protein